jgi:threonine synthase
LFTCPHTGVALAVLLKLVERRTFAPNDRIIVISTANGLKFPNFKISYHARELKEVQPRYANTPIEVPADLDAVRWELDRRLGS